MSNRFRVIVLAAICICSMSVGSNAAQTKKTLPTEVPTQKKSVLSNGMLTFEKAEVSIKKVGFKNNLTIKTGVLQEGNRAYVWGFNSHNYTTYQFEFHHYNDGRWMLHSYMQETKLPTFVHESIE